MSLSDTVGFIRDLPHKLVEAFQATLQEAADADLLLHVVDAVEPAVARADAPRSSVCSTRSVPRRCRRCWSSTSATCSRHRAARAQAVDWVERANGVRVRRVFVSARDGEGLDALREVLADAVRRALECRRRRPHTAAG